MTSPDRERSGIRLTAVHVGQCVVTRFVDGRADAVTPLPRSPHAHIQNRVMLAASSLGRITVESCPVWIGAGMELCSLRLDRHHRTHPESPAPPLPLSAGDDDGHSARTAMHAAHDPDSLREYVAGDSLETVAWKQVAKSGRWYTAPATAARQEIDLNWQATNPPTPKRVSRAWRRG